MRTDGVGLGARSGEGLGEQGEEHGGPQAGGHHQLQHLLGEGEQVCGGRLEGVQGAGIQVLGEGHPDPSVTARQSASQPGPPGQWSAGRGADSPPQTPRGAGYGGQGLEVTVPSSVRRATLGEPIVGQGLEVAVTLSARRATLGVPVGGQGL